MRLIKNMRTRTFDIWGMAATTVITIVYKPFHAFISRSIRAIRSMRRMRKKESFTPEPAKAAVRTISTIDMMTIHPSS